MKKGLWGLLILMLLLTIPTMFERSNTEWQNNTYEFIVPYDEVNTLINQGSSLDQDNVFQQLKESGVNAISIDPETLSSLEAQKMALIINDADFREKLLLGSSDFNINNLPKKQGVYIYVNPDSNFTANIQRVFADDIKPIQVGTQQYYFIVGNPDKIKDVPIGYSQTTVDAISNAGFKVVPRVINGLNDNNEFVYDNLLSQNGNIEKSILFSGKEVLGYPNHQLMEKWAEKFKDHGYSVYGVEFTDQRGFSSFANIMDFNVIRLHSLDLDNGQSIDENADLIVRAVKERNIRSIFIHFNLSDPPKKDLANTTQVIEKANSQMPGLFHPGIAKPFSQMNIQLWQIVVAAIGSIVFAMLAALSVIGRKMSYVALVGMLIVSLAYFVTNDSMLIKLLALVTAVITPIFACLSNTKVNGMKGVLLGYGKAAFISVIGIWLIVTLLVGNSYLVKIDVFRGVKLIYTVPILFMVVYAFWGNIKTILKLSIRYWHLALLIVIAGIGFYYISRTGNGGSVSSIELKIRHMLEHVLYVRPRTKEFLIGFPLYVLGLYVAQFNKRVALYIFIPGVIGYLSIVNTFTHLHIPLYVSALRSFYSLLFGLIIGLFFIIIYKWCVKYYKVFFQSERSK